MKIGLDLQRFQEQRRFCIVIAVLSFSRKIHKMKSVENICLIVAFVIMAIMDLVGNTLVVLVIRLNKSMRTPMNMLLLNLAVADMVVAVFVTIQFVIGPTFEHPSGTTGLLLCKFITGGPMSWSAAAVSVFTLVVISIER